MDDILITDEMFIALGFKKSEHSTDDTTYWIHTNYLSTNYLASADTKTQQSTVNNPFNGNMFANSLTNRSGDVYSTKLTVRVCASAEKYKLIDVINGMNWFLKADYIEKGKEEIRSGLKMLLNINLEE